MVLLLMGVSGSGKTTLGAALAARLGWPLLDADDYHPPANVAKMRRGTPLTDADRWPWLDALNRALRGHARQAKPVIVACSALRRAYRDRLSAGLEDELRWVYLKVDPHTLHRRMTDRADHFMPAALLASQLETLEEPRPDERSALLVLDADRPVEELVERVCAAWGLAASCDP